MMGMNESWQIADEIESTDEKNTDEQLLTKKLKKLFELYKISDAELGIELENLKKD